MANGGFSDNARLASASNPLIAEHASFKSKDNMLARDRYWHLPSGEKNSGRFRDGLSN